MLGGASLSPEPLKVILIHTDGSLQVGKRFSETQNLFIMEDLPVECQEHILAQIVENEYLRVLSLVSKRFYHLSREALRDIRVDIRQGMSRVSPMWTSTGVTSLNFFSSRVSAGQGGKPLDRIAFWEGIARAIPKLACLNLSAFGDSAVKEAEIAIPFFPALKALLLSVHPEAALLKLVSAHCPLLEKVEMVAPAQEQSARPQLTPALEDAFLELARKCPHLHTCSPLCFESCVDETPLLEKMLLSLPHLQSTRIQPMPHAESRARDPSVRLRSFGPRFKSLDLSGLRDRVSPALEGFWFYLSCSELESLELPHEYIQDAQLAFIFETFTKLRCRTVSRFVQDNPSFDFGFSSSLKSLSIHRMSRLGQANADILDELARSVPSLTSLELGARSFSIDASDFVLPRSLQHLKINGFIITGFLGFLKWASLKSLRMENIWIDGDLQDTRLPSIEDLELGPLVRFQQPEILTFEKAVDIWPNVQQADFLGLRNFSLMEPNPVGTLLQSLKVGAVNGKELERLSELLILQKLDLCLGDHPISALDKGLRRVVKLANVGCLRSLRLNIFSSSRSKEFREGLQSIMAQAPSHLQLEQDLQMLYDEEDDVSGGEEQ